MASHEQDVERQLNVTAMCTRLAIDPALPHLDEALTHPSFANEQRLVPSADGKAIPLPDNQRLEFLGDAVLSLCVCELLMGSFSDVDEGQLTMMRASLVNTSVLAAIARQVGVDGALRLGRGAAQAGERERANVLADALEAIVGCVYLDSGLSAARGLVKLLLADPLDGLVTNGAIQRDAKSRLQELVQARGLPPPRYRVIAETGPAHAREFLVEVVACLDQQLPQSTPEEATPNGTPRWAIIMTGEGRSKKLAEQAAASAALEAMEAKAV
jgi:ribonuclease-3